MPYTQANSASSRFNDRKGLKIRNLEPLNQHTGAAVGRLNGLNGAERLTPSMKLRAGGLNYLNGLITMKNGVGKIRRS
jgi:hypothetical protein